MSVMLSWRPLSPLLFGFFGLPQSAGRGSSSTSSELSIAPAASGISRATRKRAKRLFVRQQPNRPDPPIGPPDDRQVFAKSAESQDALPVPCAESGFGEATVHSDGYPPQQRQRLRQTRPYVHHQFPVLSFCGRALWRFRAGSTLPSLGLDERTLPDNAVNERSMP